MGYRTIILASLASCLSLSPVYAKAKSESSEKAAKKACAAGEFRKGVEILAELYVDTDDPTHIYNQGRCYEQNHQWVDAIDRFREYVRKSKKLSPEVQTDVERHIADCKLFIEEEAARTSPPPPPTTAPMPASPAAVAPPPAPAAVVQPSPTAPPPPVTNPGAALRVTGLVVGGVGVATLATGLLLNLKANSLADDANKTHDPATESSQKSYKTGSQVCYGLGGAALVTGVVLYVVGRAKGSPEVPAVALLPTLNAGEVGFIWRGGF
jgi:hypothetical protein